MKNKIIPNSIQKQENKKSISLFINNSIKEKKRKSKTINSLFPFLLFIINFNLIFPQGEEYKQEIKIKINRDFSSFYFSNLNINRFVEVDR